MVEIDPLVAIPVLSACISGAVQWIKKAVPKSCRDGDGLVFKRKGKKPIHFDDAFVWPFLSFIIGMGLFAALHYDLMGVGTWVGSLISGGAVGTAGGSAWFQGAKVGKSITRKLASGEPPTSSATDMERPDER